MNRLGTRAAPHEIARVVAATPVPLEGLMTHFASSGNYESQQTEQQLQRFAKLMLAEQAVIHENIREPVTDGAMHQNGRNGGVHSPAQGADCSGISHLLTDRFHRLGDERRAAP